MKKKWKTGKIIRTSDIERFTDLPIKVVSPEEICYNDLENSGIYYILEINDSYYFNYVWTIYIDHSPSYYLWTETGDNNYAAFNPQDNFTNANELVQ